MVAELIRSAPIADIVPSFFIIIYNRFGHANGGGFIVKSPYTGSGFSNYAHY
tara:strand:+ start:502 stop:657 length:156 start_codon:yes stop_codon:yes gene_type:complete